MAPPPELMDDAVGEIFLRIPPDDPALLLRASLVCKPWRRLLTDPAFIRRYRAFHRTPPLLGFLRDTEDYIARFVPMGPFRPRELELHEFRVLDCRHGRVLLKHYNGDLLVWNPIAGEYHHIANNMKILPTFSAAVLCAAVDCDHLDCHGGPFLVVLVGLCINDEVLAAEGLTGAWVFSSEAGEWSAPTTMNGFYFIGTLSPVLAGDKIYFSCAFGGAILCYDLRHEPVFTLIHGGGADLYNAVFIQEEGGGPRFAVLKDYKLTMWSLETVNPDGVAVWSQLGDIQLDKLLSIARSTRPPHLIGFAKSPDSDIVFVNTNAGVFTIELESHKIKKVYEEDCGVCTIFPFRSFFTPDCTV